MDPSEYQREAMRKYMEELSTHTTKIVEKPPQTELNKPLSKEIRSEKRSKKLRRNYAGILHIQSNTEKMSKKERKAQRKLKNESHRSDKNKSGYALNVEQILDGLIIQFVTLVIVKKKRAKRKKALDGRIQFSLVI